jgi:uncharacterized protein
MSRVIHFEIHATDPEALVAYYAQLLGWTFARQEGMEYWLISTGPRDQPGIDGGLLRRPVPGPATGPVVGAFVCTVQVESLEQTLARNEALGGELAMPRMPVTGMGWLAYVKDPDGNVLGLLEPDPAAA